MEPLMPGPTLAEFSAHPGAPVPLVQSLGCAQKLLREGGQDLGFRDECVPMPACPKFRFFPVAVGSQTPFPSGLAFPRLVRRHVRRAVPEYSEYPRYPSPPAGLKSKKKTGLPPGPQGGLRMGTGYAVSGLPSGPHRPLPRLLHCTGMG